MKARNETPTQLAGPIELGVGLAATLAAMWLHFIFLRHAGALWRDEAGGVQLANLPSIGGMWQMLPHGGFPAFFPIAVRAWTALGLGDDAGLRLFGFLIGLSVLAALWINARIMGYRVPMLSLAWLGANITLVRAGDSLRAYGCGSLFAVLCLGLTWRLMRSPDWKRFLLASLAGILSVQCLYQNAFLLLAVCASAAWACLPRRQWRTALVVLAAGLPAMLSLLPYLEPVRHSQDWWIISKTGFNFTLVWRNLSFALAGPQAWPKWVWIGIFLLIVVAGIAALLKRNADADTFKNDLTLFAAGAGLAGSTGFFIFIWLAQLPTQPWQYLPLITFVTACMDAALLPGLQRQRIPLAVFAALMICMLLPRSADLAKCRQTNIDLIAAQLQKSAAPDDFIILYPWYCGVTFGRYYQGQTPWVTLPALSDYRFHRYDLLKEKLQATSPIAPVVARAFATLASGHRLWIIGRLPGPQPGETSVPELPPAPNGPYGWLDAPYTYVWGRQLAQPLSNYAGKIELVPVTSPTSVSPLEDEDLPLFVLAGWRSPTPPATPH